MNKYLISKTEFGALVEGTSKDQTSKETSLTNVLSSIANPILMDWDGISYSSFDGLTPGLKAIVYCAEFYRAAKHDFLSIVSQAELPTRTLAAFETIQAQEYFQLLKQLEAMFPGKKFPEYGEDFFAVFSKQPDGYFDEIGERFVTGRGMGRHLYDYVIDYMAAHPNEFTSS